MLVITLPVGYVLPSVDDAEPTFVRCKELPTQGRMALYWMFKGGERAQASWKIDVLGGDLKERVASLNHEASKRTEVGRYGTIVDGGEVEKTQPPPTTFIIHGHDDAAVKQLKEHLSQLGLPAIVMKEQLVTGATLPEKFELVAEGATFAIALLTPDDLGGPASGPALSRARQNAWLEIGWFWGRLGRDHVMLLMKGEVEVPSDLQGLVYHPYRNSPVEVSHWIRGFYESHGVPPRGSGHASSEASGADTSDP